MSSYVADETAPRPPTDPAALFGLCPIDREFIRNSVRHTLAHRARIRSSNLAIVPKKQNSARPPDLEFRFTRSAAKFATTDT